MDNIKFKLTSLFATLVVSGAYASEPFAVWTYEECVEWARDHNISLRQSELSQESASVTLEGAKAKWIPTLDFGTTQGYSNTPMGDRDKNAYTSSYGFNGSWTLWDGGRRQSDIRRAETDIERSRLAMDDLFRDIRSEILTNYLNILYCREAVGVNRMLSQVSAAQAERAKQMMESGKISIVDYQQLESQAERDRYNVVSAEADLLSKRLQLRNLLELGIEKDIDVVPIDFPQSLVLDSLPPLVESYRLALASDSRLRYNELSVNIADEDIRAAKAGGSPQIGVTAGIGTGYYTTDQRGWGEQMRRSFNENIGLTLTVPILDNKKTRTAVAQAKIARLNSEYDIEARRQEVANILEGWYIEMESARSRYVAAVQNEKAAALSDEYVAERFAVGYVESTELLQSHQALSSARHELIQAKYMAVLARKMVEFLRSGNITL